MENTKALINDIEQDVYGIFYIYNSKYYFMYTLKESDGEDYIKLYLVQVGKETAASTLGPVDTGNRIGVEITDPNEWKSVQASITSIVEGKKNGSTPSGIQVLPITMLTNLKILSHNNFKLLKNVMTDDFGLSLEAIPVEQSVNMVEEVAPISPDIQVTPQPVQTAETVMEVAPQPVSTDGIIPETVTPEVPEEESDVIIDYRSRFFEEQEKNKALEEKITTYEQTIENIKKIIG